MSIIFTMNSAVLIFLCLSMIYPIEATENQLNPNPRNSISEREISPRILSTTDRVALEDTILPSTNLTVSQFITGSGQVNAFSTSVLSLNGTHWFTRSDYAITSAITSPFDSIVSRNSVNHSYPTSGYWNWEETANKPFDFWINPSGFAIDYIYSVYIPEASGYRDVTVVGLENITMIGVGTFEAWNVTIDIPGFPNFALYEKNSGTVLSRYLEFYPGTDFWYNLTYAEFAILPGGYTGPTLEEFSPANSSLHAPGSQVSVYSFSPYGVQELHYAWDGQTDTVLESSDFQTSLPSLDGVHNLSITVIDNIGYFSSYLLVYITDNTLPGIILNDPQNNSRIQGSAELNFTIVSGNGTFTYNWNYSLVNVSFTMSGDSTLLNVSSPEVESVRILQVYIKSESNITEVWIKSTYRFIIDNTPPVITIYDFVNNSVIKGDVRVEFSPSESVNVSYSLNSGLVNFIFVDEETNSSLIFNNLENGTYVLEIILEDEAGNNNSTSLRFSIYSSSFKWNWYLEAEKTQTYDFRDETGTLWFSFVIVSKTGQSFNLSLLTPSDSPSLSTDSQFGINFLCEVPEEVLYVSFIYHLTEPLLGINQSFQVKQWVVWNEQSQEWSEVETIYNQILHAWVTTSIGYNQYFALVGTGMSTQLKSVDVGGGTIPSFELPFVILSILAFYSLKSKRK
ncbi:hypothetical protein CEE45_01885 [Candidatus Heimdallarchaeota archaeon B3_Heim]|nr:MAG: hypothetical protein CEE45_01885 [Candidatus Heimdallarchaeota archaeon B3_Heim]